jgi:hypothetical protein
LTGKQIDIRASKQTNKHKQFRTEKIKIQTKHEHLLVSLSLFELNIAADNANISVGGSCDSGFPICAVPRMFPATVSVISFERDVFRIVNTMSADRCHRVETQLH